MSVEFKEEHSPTTGKTFRDVATVDELYQWLQGPFLSALFATTSDHNQRSVNMQVTDLHADI